MKKNSKGSFQISDAHAALSKMPLPDIKRHCIVRGMPFEQIGKSSILNLQSWLIKNYTNKINVDLLDTFDDWVEKELSSRGIDETFLNPVFRLGRIAERDEEGNVTKVKRIRGMKKKENKKRERTSDGIFSGTKKAYTVDLQKQGLTKEEVTKLVMEKFPEAKEKSISIWYNKSKNGKLR